ncbi:hypothetical protein, partial [Acinetobacter baumannii]|uniref:hypothetical protein n=1 Tax=Acinetobacter baumannii TaxID=470 RepID=UPI0011B1CC19
MDNNLIKYVTLQLLVLAGSLDENMSRSGERVLPITFSGSLVPANLPVLMEDLRARVSAVVMSSPGPTQESPSVAGDPMAVAGPTLTVPSTTQSGVAAHPATNVAAVPPVKQVNHVSPKTSRRKRSVPGVISESADVVSDLMSSVSASPIVNAVGLDKISDAVSTVSDSVESVFKPVDTALGELLLS